LIWYRQIGVNMASYQVPEREHVMRTWRYGIRYVFGLLIVLGATTYASIRVWQYVVPRAYRRRYDCHYDGTLDWLFGKDFDPSSVLNACEASVQRGAEGIGWLAVIFIALGVVALLTWVTDRFVREAWGVDTPKLGRYRRYFGNVRVGCYVSMAFAFAMVWISMRLWPFS
jgi:hypothetical protein